MVVAAIDPPSRDRPAHRALHFVAPAEVEPGNDGESCCLASWLLKGSVAQVGDGDEWLVFLCA